MARQVDEARTTLAGNRRRSPFGPTLAVVVVAATVVVVGLFALFGFVAYLFNGVASDTHSTLSIAQRATDPKAQQKQVGGFLSLETLIFRLDCDAKAHQLTAIDNDLGGHLQLSGLQASCTEIQAPALTVPSR